MITLLIVGLLGGLVSGALAASAGVLTTILVAPVGASISVTIIACLRNIDRRTPGRASHLGGEDRLARISLDVPGLS